MENESRNCNFLTDPEIILYSADYAKVMAWRCFLCLGVDVAKLNVYHK